MFLQGISERENRSFGEGMGWERDFLPSPFCLHHSRERHEVDSLAQGKVPFVFYFHPKDVKELRYITRRDAFTYPVCLDEKDDFNALNRFPGEMTFQSFFIKPGK